MNNLESFSRFLNLSETTILLLSTEFKTIASLEA